METTKSAIFINIFIVPCWNFVMYRGMVAQALVVDASTNRFQAGILAEDRFVEFFATEDDTVRGFFALLERIFAANPSFQRIIFCQGPGKLLGVRMTLMLVRVLKMTRPELEIFSYESLALAHKIRNPLSLQDIDWGSIENEEEKLQEVAEASEDTDEIDALEFRKSLRNAVPDRPAIASQTHPFEDVVCVRKNSEQFYAYLNGHIKLVGRDVLEFQEGPVYSLPTTHNISDDPMLLPMVYDLEECAEYINMLATPNDSVDTNFDPQSDYRKWEPVPHSAVR
ncbi:MAG: hypothetical protein K2L24_03040 [Opitutales bacterium]|nr:hypothetical protein [Opitutales bacterium]